LNGISVLTDTQNHSWIIDYAYLNRGPLLQDFVTLEATLKYDMLITSSFEDRYMMENLLLESNVLEEAIPANNTLDPEISKNLQIISLVRQEAAKIGVGTKHYRVGILFNALGNLLNYDPDIKYTRRELMPFLHNLISAAKVYQLLVSPAHSDLPSQALYSIWIDEEKQQVWVEGQEKNLTPQEYDLLYFLYQNAGNPCDRDGIMKEVFDLEYDPEWTEVEKRDYSDPRINSAISRLRKKIEMNPDKNKYIISVWGKGYMLKIER
jgi:DNA-binding winged helix-turn-helix (wHTH) protein